MDTLDTLSLQRGASRFWDHRNRLLKSGDASAHGSYSQLIRGAVPEVSKVIQGWLYEQAESRRPHGAYLPLSSIDTHLQALIGLHSAFATVTGGRTVRAACMDIGRLVEEEVMAADMASRDPRKFKRLVERATREHSSRKSRMRSVKYGLHYDGSGWDTRFRLKVGEPVLNAVLKGSGVFEVVHDEGKVLLGITEEALAIIQETDELAQWMRPAFQPMVIPPKPWESFDTGCYHTEELSRRVQLTRKSTKGHRKLVQQAIRNGQMRKCLSALNSIQATKLRVNTWTLDLVHWAWDEGITMSKFPRKELLEPPQRPFDFQMLPQDQQAHWRNKARAVSRKNREITANGLLIKQDLHVADTLCSVGHFYLPHNMDFRGRTYPIPYFNQQRNDYVRGMIEFAEGLPLGDTGAYWLAIHIANTGDFPTLAGKVSKLSLDDRYQWVLDNEEMILGVGRGPKEHLEWVNADQPFAFASACHEWVGFRREGPGYYSRTPVALDGSNSGVQHYSAALRAESDGRHVNLLPQDLPADIYRQVANVTLAKVEGDRGDPIADQWLAFGIDRSTVKRSTMTFGYGSERFGFAEQLRTDLMEPLATEVLEGIRGQHPFGEDQGFRAATYLAGKIWEAVNEVVSEVAGGMKFFQEIAGLLAAEDKPVTWTTPLGFPVVQSYTEWDTKRVEIFLYNRKVPVVEAKTNDVVEGDSVLKRVLLNMRTQPKTTLLKHKQRTAVAPNVIHSMDGTHLLMTVNAAVSEGITNFCLVHDSFATHAANTGRFGAIIREQFVSLYENFDIFEVVRSTALEALSEEGRQEIPGVPHKGTLDLKQIERSLYAFA